jgi:hypothetical protein
MTATKIGLICVTIGFSVCMTIATVCEDLSDLQRNCSVVLGRKQGQVAVPLSVKVFCV